MGVSAVRGAAGVARDTPKEIVSSVTDCFEKLLEVNGIGEKDIAAVLFTITPDLTSKNPAGALRAGGHGAGIPLFCMQEPVSKGMMERCVRLLLILRTDREGLKPVYIRGAERLRPDLFPEE